MSLRENAYLIGGSLAVTVGLVVVIAGVLQENTFIMIFGALLVALFTAILAVNSV